MGVCGNVKAYCVTWSLLPNDILLVTQPISMAAFEDIGETVIFRRRVRDMAIYAGPIGPYTMQLDELKADFSDKKKKKKTKNFQVCCRLFKVKVAA